MALLMMISVTEVTAAISTYARICVVKGTAQTSAVTGGLKNLNCPIKQTMNQTECRVVREKTMVETGDDSWVVIEYINGLKVKIMPNTKIILDLNVIHVYSGNSWFKVEKRKKGELYVRTPTAIAGIRGTEFLVNVKKDGTTNIQLIEGSIEVSDINQQSKMMLAAGMEVTIPGSSALNTGLLDIQKKDEWWTDWPTLLPITEMPGNNTGITSSNTTGNTLSPIVDSHVYAYSYSGWNKANWGKYNVLGAGWNPTGGEKRAYLKFDVSGIDAATFEKATLKLYHYHTAGSNTAELGVYNVTSSWNEGNGNYKPSNVADAREICWINQPSVDKYPVVYFNPGSTPNNYVEVDITVLVKSWLSGMANNGMVIKAGENYINGPESVYGFYSREHEDIDKRPQLIINGSASANVGGINTSWEAPKAVANASIAGQWLVNQHNGFKGKLNFQQNQSGQLTGDASWDRHASGTINGQITGNSVEFRISYPNGIQGIYKGTVTQNGFKINNGSVSASDGRTNSTWDATKVINGSFSNISVTGQWNVNQHNGFKGILNFQQNQSGQLTGNASWDRHPSGMIIGQISGNSVEFTISYPNGIQGIYKGNVIQNGIKIVNGSVTASDGRTSTSWDASKVVN